MKAAKVQIHFRDNTTSDTTGNFYKANLIVNALTRKFVAIIKEEPYVPADEQTLPAQVRSNGQCYLETYGANRLHMGSRIRQGPVLMDTPARWCFTQMKTDCIQI